MDNENIALRFEMKDEDTKNDMTEVEKIENKINRFESIDYLGMETIT